MDTTLDTLKALQEQRERNAALSPDELNAASEDGAKAVAEAMARGEKVFLMDDGTLNEFQNAYAIGWNSEWAKITTKR